MSVEFARHLTVKYTLLLFGWARFPLWLTMNPPMNSKDASTPVSSLTSRSAASWISSPGSTRPVGSFQIPMRAAGPVFSRTNRTRLSASVTTAPTPTVWLAFIGSVLGVPVGSHLVSMTCCFSAWWNSNPKSATAIGISSTASAPICSQTPFLFRVVHSSMEALSMLRNIDVSLGTLAGSTMTPSYRSNLHAMVLCVPAEDPDSQNALALSSSALRSAEHAAGRTRCPRPL
mmetsp:Transcript_52782/g.148675  ORF Transcript_52782/g.148675 Transcript_52782/m.148675 type:complete len:231 (-) Transcript_52782:49-741(-)